MTFPGSEPSCPPPTRNCPALDAPLARLVLLVGSSLLGWSCGGSTRPSVEAPSAPPADAPLVAAQPGAWFDAYGNLAIVGAGRRLRLVLSAPITACAPALGTGGTPKQVATRASLPFHLLSETCRDSHPAILLPEESDTASPSELERSYHEVARCASSDLGLFEGWIPEVIAASDPCPLALGLGWRLPTSRELEGLGPDDRKAVAGALFDTEDRNAFGGLLLYARSNDGNLTLSTLSPNAAEQAPPLESARLARPFFGAALRCVRDGAAEKPSRATLPVLPHASECLREQRQAQTELAAKSRRQPIAELQKLKTWLEASERTPLDARSAPQLRELSELLASPQLESIARDAREERELTERYAELAEGLDDPSVDAGERARRHAEFDNLRRRLGGQIVRSAEAAGVDRTALAALLSRLLVVLEAGANAKPPKKMQGRPPDYDPLLARVRALGGKPLP